MAKGRNQKRNGNGKDPPGAPTKRSDKTPKIASSPAGTKEKTEETKETDTSRDVVSINGVITDETCYDPKDIDDKEEVAKDLGELFDSLKGQEQGD